MKKGGRPPEHLYCTAGQREIQGPVVQGAVLAVDGRTQMIWEDVRYAARTVLPHRWHHWFGSR
ncbi:MAG: hypothetical protein ACLPLR_11665 [Terriglobales bacterium]